jgi:hypothetical protein
LVEKPKSLLEIFQDNDDVEIDPQRIEEPRYVLERVQNGSLKDQDIDAERIDRQLSSAKVNDFNNYGAIGNALRTKELKNMAKAVNKVPILQESHASYENQRNILNAVPSQRKAIGGDDAARDIEFNSRGDVQFGSRIGVGEAGSTQDIFDEKGNFSTRGGRHRARRVEVPSPPTQGGDRPTRVPREKDEL